MYVSKQPCCRHYISNFFRSNNIDSHSFCEYSNKFSSICVFFFSFLQLSDQIQNLTVSSTTSSSGSQPNSKNLLNEKNNSATTATTANNNNNNNTSNSIINISKDTAALNDNSANESLAQRVKFLQTKLAHAPMPSITSKRRQLPSIEEAWNLPISAEMSSRQQQTAQSNQQRAYAKNCNHVSISLNLNIIITSKFRKKKMY